MTAHYLGIHPAAVIEDGAQLGHDVNIGPFCHVGPGVVLGDGCSLHSHVVIQGETSLGEGTEVYPFASLGLAPQDKKYAGERTMLVIGERNVIREYVTMQPGTQGGGGVTRVGDRGLFMVGCHVAHDCQIGDDVILVNHVSLGGHVEVEDAAIIGGLSGVHQFCRIGRHAMVGAHSMIVRDVLPYTTVTGQRAHFAGLNLVGLKRHGFDNEVRRQLQDIIDTLFSEPGIMEQRLDEFQRIPGVGEAGPAKNLLTFLKRASKGRGFTGPLE
ncbi:MAG: acyl-[acyl-carrier-protein]--UDP-N-acetylglucosamine O-acyltransferase [Kiloniella sp.]|nr:acyl-[acyl-carrier-protein]--UDP-N-acetylglucosamine O-acyltransferase [Kiloniella sp.]